MTLQWTFLLGSPHSPPITSESHLWSVVGPFLRADGHGSGPVTPCACVSEPPPCHLVLWAGVSVLPRHPLEWKLVSNMVAHSPQETTEPSRNALGPTCAVRVKHTLASRDIARKKECKIPDNIFHIDHILKSEVFSIRWVR